MKFKKRVGVGDISVPRSYKRGVALEDDYLSASIQNEGLKDPIYVLENDKKLILVDGLRRLRCCKKIGMKTVPALVEKYRSSGDFPTPLSYAVFLRLTIDTKRQDLLPSQRAYYINLLTRKYGIPLAEISGAYGCSESALRGLLSVADCSEEIRMLIDNKTFPVTAGKQLSTLSKKGQLSIVHYFYGRNKVTNNEIKLWLDRLDPIRDAELLKNPNRSAVAKTRRRRERVSNTYTSPRAIGRSITDTEVHVREVRRELTNMKEMIRYSRPIIECILKDEYLRTNLPGRVISEFRKFADEEGIKWRNK